MPRAAFIMTSKYTLTNISTPCVISKYELAPNIFHPAKENISLANFQSNCSVYLHSLKLCEQYMPYVMRTTTPSPAKIAAYVISLSHVTYAKQITHRSFTTASPMLTIANTPIFSCDIMQAWNGTLIREITKV